MSKIIRNYMRINDDNSKDDKINVKRRDMIL